MQALKASVGGSRAELEQSCTKSSCRTMVSFTLIDLLVAIAIIAVLLGILLPTLSRTKQKKVTVRTMALTQLGKPQGEWAHSPSWFGPSVKLESIYQDIRTNLILSGFDSFGLYLIKDDTSGFILVTAPERINTDGTPHAERFNLARKLLPKGPLKEVFLPFFSSAPEGEYRIFAFAVTTELPLEGDSKPEWALLATLADEAGDYAHLPENLRDLPVGEARLHTYVYVFQREKSERYPHPVQATDLSVQEHLKKAGFTNFLEPTKL